MALRAVTWDVWGRNQLSKPFQKYLSLLDFLALNLQYKKPQYFLPKHILVNFAHSLLDCL